MTVLTWNLDQLGGGGVSLERWQNNLIFARKLGAKNKSFFSPIFELSSLAYNAKKIAKVNGFNK